MSKDTQHDLEEFKQAQFDAELDRFMENCFGRPLDGGGHRWFRTRHRRAPKEKPTRAHRAR